jgi:hypothetical protein
VSLIAPLAASATPGASGCPPRAGPARQFAPIARMSGLIGPEYAVADDAGDLTRLLAIFGRRDPG